MREDQKAMLRELRAISSVGELADASPQAQRLYEYWTDQRGPAAWPMRAKIDPLHFRFALGRVSIIERIDGRFRYRLVSTGLTEHLGYEMTGKFADEIPEPESRTFSEQQYTTGIERAAPLYTRGRVHLDGRDWTHETLILPLSSDGTAVDMLMIYRATDEPKRGR